MSLKKDDNYHIWSILPALRSPWKTGATFSI
jgi:hypothetical protein